MWGISQICPAFLVPACLSRGTGPGGVPPGRLAAHLLAVVRTAAVVVPTAAVVVRAAAVVVRAAAVVVRVPLWWCVLPLWWCGQLL
jgi:hypothetical protein